MYGHPRKRVNTYLIFFIYIIENKQMMSIIRYPLYFLEPLIALSEDLESVSNFFISESFNFTKVIIILINKNKKVRNG